MNEISEIKLPKGVESISVTQHDDKIVIKFIPKEPKFKVGDSVKIKDGISSKTHRHVSCMFVEEMDKYIGKRLIVHQAANAGHYALRCTMDNNLYSYDEDWLEPWSDELKKGDLAIFWGNEYGDYPLIRMYDSKDYRGYYDSCGLFWDNAIKFESKEQYEKILKGEG